MQVIDVCVQADMLQYTHVHVLVKVQVSFFPYFLGQRLHPSFIVLLFFPPRRRLSLAAVLAAVQTPP